MAKILSKCPICGGKLEYSSFIQFTKDYWIKLKLQKQRCMLYGMWVHKLYCL